jgi:transposase
LATAPGGGEPLHGHGHQRTEDETTFVSTPATTVLARLLPDATALRLDTCHVDTTTAQITVAVRATPATAPCPLCTTLAHRIHSHYERTVADLPWAQYRVRLQLRVRKWFCPNPACVRRIFTERLPTVAAPWARRTLRLAQRQPAQLDPWLTRATTSMLEAMRRFAKGLYEDYAAVKAGVTLPWSSGPVEGHINRLKMLKRQMFGRACLDLLSRRFLRAPRPVARQQQQAPAPAEPPALPVAA